MTLQANVVARTSECGVLIRAAADGLQRHGIATSIGTYADRGRDFTLCWGWRAGRIYQGKGHRVLLMERGYIGDRFHWTSIAWDGLNGRGDFCLPAERLPERFSRHFAIDDWKPGGSFILITGQVPGDMSLGGRNLTAWYAEAAEKAAHAYRLPVYFRPHPIAVQRHMHKRGAEAVSGPLEAVLRRCAVVLTWNSNSAVDAVLAGVPSVTMDQGSMAWPVTAHAIGGLERPDRTEWANRLSWCQWTPEELAAGDWWERMRQGLECSRP